MPFTVIAVGVAVGLLMAIFVVMLILYRIRKKDEGEYTVDEEPRMAVNYRRGGGAGIYS